MDNGDGLGESEVALYRAVLAHPRATLGQAAAELGRTDGEVDKAWAKLLEMGLLRMDGDEALIAVNPMLAEAMVLGAEELELSARRASVEAPPGRDPPAGAGLEHRADPRSVDLGGRGHLRPGRDRQRADALRRELSVRTAVGRPGRLPRTRVDHRTRVANLYSLRRGINTRALYQHAALRDRHTRAYLTELAANGAQDPLRALGTGPQPGGRPRGRAAADPHRRSRPARPGRRPRAQRDRLGHRHLRAAVGRGAAARGRHHAGATTTPSSTRPGRRSCG